MAINRNEVPEGKNNISGYEEGAIDVAHPTKTTRHKKVKSLPLDKNPAYAQMPYVENTQGEKYIEKIRREKARRPDDPTTASVPSGMGLPQTISQADPRAIAQSLTSMFSMLAMVAATMKNNSPASITVTNTNALTGALVLLANKIGFEKVIAEFEKILANDGINNILPQYQQMVKDALANLIKKAIENGSVNKIPETPVPVVVYGVKIPTPLYLTEKVPDLYLQQYYTQEDDPYPGYIEWRAPEGATTEKIIYTKRTTVDYPYDSADAEIVGTAEQKLYEELLQYFSESPAANNQFNASANNQLNSVTSTSSVPKVFDTTVLNTAMANSQAYIQTTGMNKTLGKNSSNNLMNLLTQLLGIVAIAINLTRTLYLPRSTLNQASVNASLQQFSRNIAMLKQMQSRSTGAFRPAGYGLGSLGSLYGFNSYSSTNTKLQQINLSIAAAATTVNLLNRIGAFDGL